MFYRYDIINLLIERCGLSSYLEIGLREGKCFDQIRCELKESVDPYWMPTYMMTSDAFFATNKKKYDIIFIDGEHEEEQVLRDISNSLSCLNDDGFIVVHDCNPQEYKHTIEREGTVYAGFIKARQSLPYDSFCVDADHGCGVISKRKLPDSFATCAKEVDWDSFVQEREAFLGLISVEKFKEICEQLSLDLSDADTDKETRHGYISHFYQKEFARYRDMPVDLLEIGVYLGGSLRMWRKYFRKGTVQGIDIKEFPGVDYIIGNAYTKDMADSLPDFDIIIDDGTHTLIDQIIAIKLYAPKIKPGGILVIEDVQAMSHVPILEKYAEGYNYEVIDLRHVKKQSDNILFVIRIDKTKQP
jgi:predicted O-methyltransferase YrrM